MKNIAAKSTDLQRMINNKNPLAIHTKSHKCVKFKNNLLTAAENINLLWINSNGSCIQK